MTTLVLAFALLQGSPDALSEQALGLAAAGRVQEAEGLWRRAVDMAPAHFPSLFNLGFLSIQQRQDQRAVEWLQRAARVNPQDFNCRYLLGTAFSRLGRADDALRAWRAALALQPGNRKLLQVMSVEYSKGRYFEEAAKAAELALRSGPPEPGLYFLAMQARQDAGQPEAAFALARQALQRFPQSARANFEVGYRLHKLGQWDEAMPYFEKAVAADGNYEEPHAFRGDVLLRRDDTAGAEKAFRRAIAIRPNYTLARMGLARALTAQGKLEAAAEELRTAAKLDAENPQPYLLLAQTLFRLGREEAARQARETSQRLRSARPEALSAPEPRPFPAQ